MFDKLGQAKQMAEGIKQKLETISVIGEAGAGKVTLSGNRKLKEITIADELLNGGNKKELQDLIVVAMNRALESAENAAESETRAMMSRLMPVGGHLKLHDDI